MITKEERDADRASCEAAPDSLAKMVDDVGRIDLVSENTSIFGYDPIAVGVGEAFADFAITARNRLPLYIAALDIHDAKLRDIETLLKNREERAEEMERAGQHVSASILRDKALGLRDALHILRGET